MKRVLLNVICLLSLLLCIATIAFWFRSYRSAEYFAYCLETKEFGVISSIGRVVIYNESAIEPFRWKAPFGFQYAAHPAPPSTAAYAQPHMTRHASWMGFEVISGNNRLYRASARFVPHWAIALATGILPTMWIRRLFRRRQPKYGFEVSNTAVFESSSAKPSNADPQNRV